MRKTTMILLLAALACVAVVAAGCHTSEGFGKDIESSGRSIKNSARKHND